MYVRNWKTANKKALRINGTPLFLQETVYTFSSICQILFQIFFGISECAKCSAFVFQCVHILFMIHSKNFHSLIMPNSFFPFILPNVSEMSQNIFRYMLYTLFSQYFILILFEYTFFHNCQAALCLASSLFRAFFIFSFLRTQGSLLPLSSSRTHVRLGA